MEIIIDIIKESTFISESYNPLQSLEGIMLPAHHTVCGMLSHLTQSRPDLSRGELWTQVNAERARGGPQTSLVNVVQPRGCIFEAGISFTTQSNLNSNVEKMQISRLFWRWCYHESQ